MSIYMLNTGSTPPNDPNLPCGDLLENRDHYNKICVPLYHASRKGDWEAANVILEEHQHLDLLMFAITEYYDTALHIAASVKGSKKMEMFVENLVNKMTRDHLELQNKNYNTALSLAAAIGNTKIAVIMVKKNRALLDIPDSKGMLPLYTASLFGQRDMVNYLYDNSNRMTGEFWTDEKRGLVLLKCVEADMFDVALKIVSDQPEFSVNGIGSVLGVLARRATAFIVDTSGPTVHLKSMRSARDAKKLLRRIWKTIVKLPKATIDDIMGEAESAKQLIFIATEMGNTTFVVEAIRHCPDLIWRRNSNNQTIFHVAVSHRREKIYGLVHEIGLTRDMITSLKDEEGNNILHLVGKYPKKDNVGLQMQRELMWFKEVKALMPPCEQESKNKDGLTPHELFRVEHKDMFFEDDKFMKDTASQCLVVATLIAAIGFALATTVPGGFHQENGIPMFLHNPVYIVFTALNVTSLIFSTGSILHFLSLFVSYKREHDFMEELPRTFRVGVATLNWSIGALLLGFSVSFFLYYHGPWIWVPILITIAITFYPLNFCGKLQHILYTKNGDPFGNPFRLKKNTWFFPKPRRV